MDIVWYGIQFLKYRISEERNIKIAILVLCTLENIKCQSQSDSDGLDHMSTEKERSKEVLKINKNIYIFSVIFFSSIDKTSVETHGHVVYLME